MHTLKRKDFEERLKAVSSFAGKYLTRVDCVCDSLRFISPGADIAVPVVIDEMRLLEELRRQGMRSEKSYQSNYIARFNGASAKCAQKTGLPSLFLDRSRATSARTVYELVLRKEGEARITLDRDEFAPLFSVLDELGEKFARELSPPHRAASHREQLEADPHTPLDNYADLQIAQCIEKHWPGEPIMIEESHPEFRFERGHRWVIDPLDGSRNTVLGRPDVAISIARMNEDSCSLAVIDLPLRKIRLVLRDGVVTVNKVALSSGIVNVPDTLSKAFVAVPGDFIKMSDEEQAVCRVLLQNAAQFAAGIRISGALAFDLAGLALGELGVRVSHKLKPWDVAAGVAIIRALGGWVTDMNGQEWTLASSTILAAASRKLHAEAMSLMDDIQPWMLAAPNGSRGVAPGRRRLPWWNTSEAMRELIDKVKSMKPRPTVILGINRGGAIVGGVLSKALNLEPPILLRVRKEEGDHVTEMRADSAPIRGVALLCDDTMYSGGNLKAALAYLFKKYPKLQVQTAILLTVNAERGSPEFNAIPPAVDFSGWETDTMNLAPSWEPDKLLLAQRSAKSLAKKRSR
ncbi:MAG: hypothetical protein JSR77_17505 [Planctomycetes bacterium]|nr:hypothetical protein [Planctomycetota bacterium]